MGVLEFLGALLSGGNDKPTHYPSPSVGGVNAGHIMAAKKRDEPGAGVARTWDKADPAAKFLSENYGGPRGHTGKRVAIVQPKTLGGEWEGRDDFPYHPDWRSWAGTGERTIGDSGFNYDTNSFDDTGHDNDLAHGLSYLGRKWREAGEGNAVSPELHDQVYNPWNALAMIGVKGRGVGLDGIKMDPPSGMPASQVRGMAGQYKKPGAGPRGPKNAHYGSTMRTNQYGPKAMENVRGEGNVPEGMSAEEMQKAIMDALGKLNGW